MQAPFLLQGMLEPIPLYYSRRQQTIDFLCACCVSLYIFFVTASLQQQPAGLLTECLFGGKLQLTCLVLS
jgi:hypothetical protein